MKDNIGNKIHNVTTTNIIQTISYIYNKIAVQIWQRISKEQL